MADYDLETDVGRVRLLISDIPPDHVFEDNEIQTFLTLRGDLNLAAASALRAIATNETLLLKKLSTVDVTTDGPALSEALLAQAAVLESQQDGGGHVEVAGGLTRRIL